METCLPGPSPHPAYKERKEHWEAFWKVCWRSGEQGLLICIPLLTSSSEDRLHTQIMVTGQLLCVLVNLLKQNNLTSVDRWGAGSPVKAQLRTRIGREPALYVYSQGLMALSLAWPPPEPSPVKCCPDGWCLLQSTPRWAGTASPALPYETSAFHKPWS